MELGNLEIAGLLEKAGAPASPLTDVERFTSMCVAGDVSGARAMLQAAPDLMERAPKSMVLKTSRRASGVRLALDLGFDPDYVDEVAALHSAAGRGDEEVVDGTPLGWADFFHQDRMRDKLLNEGPICLFDALDHHRLDRVPDILARGPAALNRTLPSASRAIQDRRTAPLVRMVDRGDASAARVLLEHGADVRALHPDGRSLRELARDKGHPEIVDLLEALSTPRSRTPDSPR